jgi:CubicO group peptidase (beta-lactamase class C family)
MQTTPLLSYLLFEDGKIVVDEITPKDRFGDKFSDTSMYHSMSMGKSITSYLAGHAICEGKIKSVDSRLDWPILKNTLYDNQKLINLLNMASGDRAYSQNDESGESIQRRMATEFKGSKKSNHQYHYTNLNTNLVLSYLLYTYGEEGLKRLFDDVFQKKVGIKNEVWLNKTPGADKHEKSLGHQFFMTRYDFLRIARAMLDDWQNDTCVGQYLKTIHERRISKNGAQGNTGRVGMPGSYGGFFHTGYKGMESRPVMGMDGNGGQTILIDFDRGRIVVTQAVFDNMRFPKKASYDWEKISYERIKNGKPSSRLTTAKSATPVMDPQELILHNEARRESDRKAKEYWDEYYDKIFFGSSADGSILLSEDFENLAGRDLLADDRDDQWDVKKDSDGNTMYCNKKVTTDDYAGFNLGSENWRDYSISYRMKFTSGKGGELETHIRKKSSRQGEYRSVINSVTGNTFLKYVKGADRINKKIANGSKASIRDKWTDIQLIASGNNISYIVNGKEVASTEDDRLKKGAVMFAVTSKSELCIDDIVIKKETPK